MSNENDFKSIRLNKSMREDIVLSVMSKWGEKNPQPDVAACENNFALWLWGEKFGKHEDDLKSIPEEFLNTSKQLKFCVDGQVDKVELSEAMPVTWGEYSYKEPVLKTIRSTNKEYQKYIKVVEDNNDWKKKYNELHLETETIIDSVNSTGQLVKLWPQCMPFLPAYIANPGKAINLPAIQISRLNERIGLED